MKNPQPTLTLDRLWHGGDYNPEQWLDTPEVWDEDLRLMKLAHVNEATVGVFSWATLEPEEGRFAFEWLDAVMDRLARNGIDVVLATPSGARPAWLAQRYPEVLRVSPDRQRELFGERHNHCPTSPVYRRLCQRINRALAERYGRHPALKLWHVSNEYGGECHCDFCQNAFRAWLQRRYGTLERLNQAWWTRFWSHTYTSWDQIESPSPRGMRSLHGLNLDWKRFVTEQTLAFMQDEIAPLRELTPQVPITTNFMGTYPGLNYWRFADTLDVISWDNYPRWHAQGSDVDLASSVAFLHDLARSFKHQPFLMMESTPSTTNWMTVSKLKRPGMHRLSSLQAVAHGSDSVQYFQWRKSRGGPEKFHGAVVDHAGHERTRVFADVAEVGEVLEKLRPVAGSQILSSVAILYDWENRWAIDDAMGPRRDGRDYQPTCEAHHRALWRLGVMTDVINMDQDFSRYRLLVAPMLYMVREGVAERLEAYVRDGGTVVLTYWSGVADATDLCFIGGAPGPLKRLLGLWVEEIDAITEDDANVWVMEPDNSLNLHGTYGVRQLCERIHPETADVLARYGADFYAGEPAMTVNRWGAGAAYYLAARTDQRFLNNFYAALARELHLPSAVPFPLPEGVSATVRVRGAQQWTFLMNFSAEPREVHLGDAARHEVVSDRWLGGAVTVPPYGVLVLEAESPSHP
ncbi:MAG: beta-galactosidase [Firmicutes bacterium]|nr:beta-galactosidase [Bacillota bacterium]